MAVEDTSFYTHALVLLGGAVVADSDPRDEYIETLDKARALISALRNVKAVND